jgi:DNA adenine methylase
MEQLATLPITQSNFWGDDSIPTAVVNVASVPHRSPFRYPGGKTWLVPRIREWLSSSPNKPQYFIEPFAGGAIVGLTVAFENLADYVVLVERDEQVAAVWKTILRKGGAEWLANRIVNFDMTPESVQALFSTRTYTVQEKAFKTIVQNRINHGGILAPGAGRLRNGENGRGIRSRWYPATLKKRILDIAQIRDRIAFVRGDGFEVIREYAEQNNCAFFIDPPYTASSKRAGTRLYKYHQIDHEDLFRLVRQVKGDWLMTYDEAEEVRSLAVKHRFETRLVGMSTTHHTTTNELLIGRDLTWVR